MRARLATFALFVVALSSVDCALAQSADEPSRSAEPELAARSEQPAAAPSLREKLATQVDVDLHDKSLADLPGWLRDSYRVKAVLDIQALEEAGIELTSPLDLRVQGISLRSALRHLLREHDVTWAVDGELLVITTPEEVEQNDLVAVYNVADLLSNADESRRASPLDYDSLLEVLQSCVASDSWYEGKHPFALLEGTIAFPQTEEVHEQVALLLQALKEAKQRATNPTNSDWSSIFVESAGSQKLRAALAEPTKLVFADTRLDQVVQQVSDARSIPVVLDGKALEEAGVAVDIPLKFEERGLPLGQTLRRLLAPKDLVAVGSNEALVITTLPEAEQSFYGLRVYPVADLIAPSGEPTRDDAHSVIEAMKACSSSDWEGSPGQACYLPACRAVVVTQLDEVHEEIDKVLSDLRKARAEQGPRAKPDENELLLKVYRLGQPPRRSDVPAEVAAALIQEFVAPETWTKDPDVRLRTAPDRLVIRQRRGVHKQIERFLEELGLRMGRGMGGSGVY